MPRPSSIGDGLGRSVISPANGNPPAEFLTVKQVASRYGVTVRSVYSWIAKGKLPAFRIGGVWRVNREDLPR